VDLSIFSFQSFLTFQQVMKFLWVFLSILMVWNPIDGIDISCRVRFYRSDYFPSSQWGCAATITNFDDPQRLGVVTGVSEVGRNNDEIGYFYIEDQQLLFFPTNLADIFPNLIAIRFARTNISAVSYLDLEVFPDLTFISLQANQLESVDGDLFDNNRELLFIGLSGNLIQHVGFNLFTSLTKLKRVTFFTNPCVNAAGTGQSEIQKLNDLLPEMCPPLIRTTPKTTTKATEEATTTEGTTTPETTTTEQPQQCQLRCTLDQEFDDLKARLMEVEKQLREINSNPRV
jgi:hypothetical protein